jgi:protein arginine kinase activator
MAKNLKCSLCDKEATVHLTQIVDNKIHKVDLCEACAQKKGVTNPEGFSLADLLTQTAMTPGMNDKHIICPDCGFETADFRRSGRLGCAQCYTAFSPLIKPVLEDMHSGGEHTGKIPEVASSRHSTQHELHQLNKALSQAVAEEAYEDAAKYRDQIKALEDALCQETEMGSS